MQYPKLKDFLYSYFERSCLFNKKHCKDKEEYEQIEKWKQMSHDDIKRLILSKVELADDIERAFEVDRLLLIKEHQRLAASTSNIQNAPQNVENIHGSFLDRQEQRYVEFTQKLWRTQHKIDEVEKLIRTLKNIIIHFPDYTKADNEKVLPVPQKEELSIPQKEEL